MKRVMRKEKLNLILMGFVLILSQIILISAACNTDSDCGTNNVFGSSFCISSNLSNVYKNGSYFTCNNPGTNSSFCSNLTLPFAVTYCNSNQYCLNALCTNFTCISNTDCNDNNISTEDICNNPATPNSSCTYLNVKCNSNLDCGTDTPLGYAFCSTNNKSILQNYITYTCNNPGTGASSCSNSTPIITTQTCLLNQVCENAICKNITCLNNLSCNDNNPYTEDRCINANTTNSYCDYIPIICLNNVDCGNNFFFGSLFCSSNKDISQNYINYTCNFPGTIFSYCSNSTNVVLNTTCQSNQLCLNGTCIGINCLNDNNCSDNNPYTEDRCINANTTNSFCSYTNISCLTTNDVICNDGNFRTADICIFPNTTNSFCNHSNIICFSDSECGISGFIGNEFCSSNNQSIFRNYTQTTCINPGTENSTCTSTTTQNIIKTCLSNQSCDNAICKDIICSNDLQCNDANPYTFDKCYNSGTVNSFCNVTNIACLGANDSKCNDNNSYTEDICFSPGTVNSSCNHFNITCFNSNDCGNNSYIGNNFCNGNNIFNNYLTYTCNNPGTKLSSCSYNETPTLIQPCLTNQACSNGSCCSVTCFNDSNCNDANSYTLDQCIGTGTCSSSCVYTNITCVTLNDLRCDDQNASTEDKCINSNTINSNCTHEKINCTIDTDCGTNRFIFPAFCGENNSIITPFLSFKCMNPGTGTSFCTNTTSPFVNSTCLSNQLCLSGLCQNINCSNDTQCSDIDPYTLDSCNNPGTLNSSCSHTNITCLTNNDIRCNDNNSYTEDKCILPNTTSSYCNYTSIRCIINTDCTDNNTYTEDKCILANTTSSYCTNSNIICFNDSMCGNNGFIGNKFCNGNSINGNYQSFECLNDGTSQSYCTNLTSVLQIDTCLSNQVCENAICKNVICFNDTMCNDNISHTEDHCLNPSTSNASCLYLNITCLNDSDSNCNDNNISTEDHCLIPGTTSSICSHIPIKCFSNSDCNDLNSSTEDICNNPATTNSTCSHLPINCTTDLDCGKNAFLGDKFCNENNIVWNYTSYTCNNKNTSLSFCSSKTEVQIMDYCTNHEACNNALCVNIRCFNNSECNDNNSYTFDSCNNLGQITSYCSNISMECITPNDPTCNDNNPYTVDSCINYNTTNAYCNYTNITCITSSDCGEDGLIGDKFCSENNKSLNRNLITFTCNNPNSSLSYCTNITKPTLVDSCLSNQLCENAICKNIICSNDTQCADTDPYTLDSCYLPGTTSSSCYHINLTCISTIDSRCDDLNESTEDRCINNNTIGAYCTHLPIICSSDIDCGTNGYVGSKFCSNDNRTINRNFITYICNNPGTSNSSCKSTPSIFPIDTCTNRQSCLNAVCEDITCFNNSECDDLNESTYDLCNDYGKISSTCSNIPIRCTKDIDCNDNNMSSEDTCINPGELNAECKYQTIVCFEDSQCGIDDFNGPKFCGNNNNILQNYISYKCLNPGKVNSSCSSTNSNIQMQKCSSRELCDNAECKNIKCFSNNECDDTNDLTYDVCINPGNFTSNCTNIPINCSKDLDCNDNNIYTQDKCEDPRSLTALCKYTNITCITNSDCGMDKFLGDPICGNLNNIVWSHISYTCHIPNSTQSYCSSNTIDLQTKQCTSHEECNNATCMNIRCFNNSECNDNDPYTYDICLNQSTVSSSCSYIPIKCLTTNDPICNDNDIKTFDECLFPNTFSAVCNNTPIACLMVDDPICNDNNTHTEDKCINPNTVNSYCNHTNIECFNDSECGESAFIGNKFCTNNEVHWNYKTFKCSNPGTINSKCSNSTADQKLWDCSSNQICNNETGRCQNKTIICSNDLNCSDSNPYTEDKCINPNTTNSFCNYTNITCITNSDCGANGFVGNLFCTNNSNNVFGNYISYTCNNKNTTNSSCSSSPTILLNKTCLSNEICSNGSCIINIPNETICIPGQTKCNGTNSYKQCLNNSHWSGILYCDNNQICSNSTNSCISNVSFKIIYPIQSKNYNTNAVPINITNNNIIADRIEYIDSVDSPNWNTLCIKCSNFGYITKQTRVFSQGNHTINVRITKNGISQQYPVSFFVDSIKPKVSSISPSSGFSNGSDFFIKFTETNPENITLVYGSNNVTKYDCNGDLNCLFNLNLSSYENQFIQYYFTITDISGNTVKSNSVKIKADTTAPIINNPNSMFSQSGKYIIFNISVTELNLNSVKYIENDKISNICTSLNKGYCTNRIYFSSGSHSIIVRAIDKAGNYVDKAISFVV